MFPTHVKVFVIAVALAIMPSESLAGERGSDSPVLWGTLKPGTFAVGFRVIRAYDASRTWTSTADRQGHRIVESSGRPIRIAVWYPARANPRHGRLAFGAYTRLSAGSPAFVDAFRTLDARGVAGLHRFLAAGGAFDALMAAPTAAVSDAASATGRFPLVAYSAGLNESVQAANSVLCEYLASHGYVVLTIPQLGTDPLTTSLGVAPADLETQTRDLEFAIGAMADAPYVDHARLATMGHSMGGVVALLVAMRRNDVDAVVGLDATFGFAGSAEVLTQSTSYAPRAVRAPLLDLRRAGAQLDSSVVDALRYSDRSVIELPGMGHGDFTSYPMIALRFRSTVTSRTAETPSRGYQVVCEYVLNFLDATLEGSADARRFVSRAPDENGLGLSEARYRRMPGLEAPPSEAQFVDMIREAGLAKAIDTLRRFREREPDGQIVREPVLNRLGYEALADGSPAEAVSIFLLNVEAHPDSANAYDSLADGYLGSGDRANAAQAYEHVLETLPRDTAANERDKAALKANATERLKELRAPR